MKKHVEGQLPDELISLLDDLADVELAGRLKDVLVASAICIDRLAAIHFVSLEPVDADEGTADLALWEMMAPAVGDTVVAVNELCEVIDTSFPAMRSRKSLFGENPSAQRADYEAAAVFRTISPLIKREVSEVGTLLRRPELLASHWALLAELHRLRAQVRSRVGDAVYLSAGALGATSREQVVPGFAQEVVRALSFRTAHASLRRTVLHRLESPTTGAALARNVDGDLESLCATPAWRHVKIETKREMLRLRAKLKAVPPDPGVEVVSGWVRPMLDVLDATSTELARVLVSHDREARGHAIRRAEQAELHLVLETGAAGWALEAALEAAQPLHAMSAVLDELLHRAARLNVGELSDTELMPLVAELSRVLSRLAL